MEDAFLDELDERGRASAAVVVNPPGPGNRTVVRVGPRGNTVVNPPGPGRIVIRH